MIEERYKVVDILADHHARGMLRQEELEDRLGAALTAQTTAELGRLVVDLPLRPADPAEGVSGTAGEKRWSLPTISRNAWRKVATVVGVGGGFTTISLYWAAFSHDDTATFWASLTTGILGLGVGGVLGWRSRRTKDDER